MISAILRRGVQLFEKGEIPFKSVIDLERMFRLHMDAIRFQGAEGMSVKERLDNISSLADALRSSGWDDIPDLSEKGGSIEDEDEGPIH